MATRDELYQALRNADAAGDTEGARKLAVYIQTLPAEEKAIATKASESTPEPSTMEKIGQGAGNLVAGAVRGAGSIGATILAPYDMAKDALAGKGLSLESNRQRRADMDAGLQTMGAQPDSMLYKGGKLAGEIAGTAGAGGVVANGVRAVAPGANALAAAIETGGLSGGGNMLTRIAGGAVSGGAQAGLANPSDATTGAVLGGALPVAAKLGGMAGHYISDARDFAAKKLMQSALKPTIKQLKSGDAEVAVNTLLGNGINATKGGVNKLRALIDDTNSQIADKIQNSGATIDKQQVLNALADVRGKFSNQVSPTSDLSAIQGVADDFANHPSFPGNDIPVRDAQALKQGTYKVLSKKYGQLGSADTEAQKGLARGLKEQIANAVPEVSGLNAKESDLIRTLGVTERRALMDMNKNPMGLAALAHNPASWAMFMADKSALFKSLAARMVNTSGSPSQLNRLANPEIVRLLPGGVASIRGESSP
jgi:hypothetical protein